MERVIFGDNQFFGVNHMSEEKARLQAMRFRDTASIIEVLDTAYQAGIRTFMCTTHDRMSEVCDFFRSNTARYPDYQFYPCMPYAHKYANAVTDLGMLGALKSFLPEDGALSTLVKGGAALAKSDVESLGRLLIDAEMKMFHGLSTPVVFIQNVMTDLLLGLGIKNGFRVFAEHIREKYQAEPGFITMNVPLLLDALDEQGIENPIVCANINKAGFRMSGGIQKYEEALHQRRFRPIAMSVFASGAIPAKEAIEYVCNIKQIESIVFGASSGSNIRQTKSLIDQYSK
jgi:hypothetical protein